MDVNVTDVRVKRGAASERPAPRGQCPNWVVKIRI
jgi:hypothetical protein